MIDSKKLDPHFKFEVAKEMGKVNVTRCFACGTCTAGCPVRVIDSKYNPRKIIRMVLLGMREEVLSSDFIWLCSTCYTCYDRCPQDVMLTSLMTTLRNIAVREGHVHPAFKEQARLVGSFGRLYEVEDFDNKKREKMGLPPVKKIHDEVVKLLEHDAKKEAES
ncbi:MAG: 4Fe-4S dicluster domain-containing protein [Candidatus Thermoplasmatota archaeon]|nr:4Fe-4S dicluster domain-containing protein [Euryarchaeota archaeon]MBU4032607.1 4Fe-4S dicluster domain-containing protein [Candidatus Thermoplasmatota archaeon]MBU4070566.1 4Fe-4S dicluster domain-containing protein [Candidatus Thermoplasmatota archaeon]MBU4144719.1 4Fe-4S dicluster domain-containing protein [Candidatus Thermoplasmatota archaeon]MBU4591472.1 4Fe-4S dicluster domain-containing protein [Candidatus Thermoplasmatota archaeon]